MGDRLNRPLHDLRISVTDRCNFRCTYCMPKETFGHDYPFLERSQLLSFEEITRVVKIFHGLGVEKVRITGGEPLLRRHLERLIEMLANTPGLDLTLTTNGSLLAQKARLLKDAGLKRVTVSLDSLDDKVFKAMNDADFPVAKVLEGIDVAAATGLPVKINMVVKRGLNDDSIVPMARHFKNTGHILRFIEYMDVGKSNGWRMDDVVSAQAIIQRIHTEMPLEPINANYPGEVAQRWRYRDGSGEIGVIASVTQAFCRDCSRLRLSAEGSLYTCLFATVGYDIRTMIRDNHADADIANTIANVWRQREDRYSEIRTSDTAPTDIQPPGKIEMSYIGG